MESRTEGDGHRVIVDLTRERTLAVRARLADTCWWRMRGMIGRRFEGFDALVFDRCGSIHTFFMGMPIDVLFLDGEGRVRGLRHGLRAWRMAAVWGACRVIELPAGVLSEAGCEVGDTVRAGA